MTLSGRYRPGAWARTFLLLAAMLLLNLNTVSAQVASNSTTSVATLHATTRINFDFTSAAVASFVLVMLGLAAALIILARHLSRAKTI